MSKYREIDSHPHLSHSEDTPVPDEKEEEAYFLLKTEAVGIKS